jgi:hypothetical protein
MAPLDAHVTDYHHEGPHHYHPEDGHSYYTAHTELEPVEHTLTHIDYKPVEHTSTHIDYEPVTYTTKHIDVPVSVVAEHDHHHRDEEEEAWRHGEYHWNPKTGLFEYHPIDKRWEMPETIEHEMHQGEYHSHPVVVGGKTKYSLFNPPETPPVREAKQFEQPQQTKYQYPFRDTQPVF